MRYPPGLLDEIRARLPVSAVVARKVQLKKAGREWKGLSPFKQENTPSFTVNDQKGFYHCFATGEHGDIFKFLMVTEGLQFPEAVTRLAEEAGIDLPKPSARDVQVEEARDRLAELMEATAAYFESLLKSGAGRVASEYLDRRGVSPAARAHFRIGYETPDRQALRRHLADKGFTDEEMIRTGMLIGGADIPTPYSRFRGRVMFPITDLRGRVIAFGGRALDPSVPAKYLNSPETPLFHKGSVLFNAAAARVEAHKRGEIIVCEGYMDVVALWEAGFPHAVAPLGTAVTERQLDLLWRFAEPVFCLDGDNAGRKAATRALETALPQLTTERQLTFAFLPDGLDPDDLLKQQGAPALTRVLESAIRVFDYIWQVSRAEVPGHTVEDMARLEGVVAKRIGQVPDDNLRRHYGQALKDAIYKLSRERRSGSVGSGGSANGGPPGADTGDWRMRVRNAGVPGPGRRGPPGPMNDPRRASSYTASVARSSLVTAIGGGHERERLILRALLQHPWLIDEDAEEIGALDFDTAPLASMRDALLNLHAERGSLDTQAMIDHVRQLEFGTGTDFLNHIMGQAAPKSLAADAAEADIIETWRDLLKLQHEGRTQRDLEALTSNLAQGDGEGADYDRLLSELSGMQPEHDET